MTRVLIFHACGHPEWHELPAMGRRDRAAVEARMTAMDCPRCWSGSDDEYEAAWGAAPPPAGDGRKGGGR